MYVIAGITGQTGAAAAKKIKEAGHVVRVLVRKESQVAALEIKGYEVRVVDLLDTAGLTATLRGAQGAYLLIPPFYGPGILDHQQKIAESISNALAAAKLPRTVLLSSVGAEHAEGTGPVVACHRLERLTQGLAGITYLRAAYFLENWLSVASAAMDNNILPSFLEEERTLSMVASQDIGECAAALLTSQSAPPSVVQLAAKTDYQPKDIAAAYSEVLGTSIRLVTLPLSKLVETFTGAGAPQELAELFLELYEGVSAGKLEWKFDEVRRGKLGAEDVLRAKLKK